MVESPTQEDHVAFIDYIRAFVAEHPRPGEPFVLVPTDVYNALKRLGSSGVTYEPFGVRLDGVLWSPHHALTPTMVNGAYEVPFAFYCHQGGGAGGISWVLYPPEKP